MIQSTKDYDIFKINPKNPPLEETHVNKILGSILQNNMLSVRPILVDDNMVIIDGHNRLEAAKRLGEEVYYIVQKDISDRDMILLNNNARVWKIEDYIRFYAKSGNESYKKILSIIEETKLSASEVCRIFKLEKNKKKNRDNNIKSGEIKEISPEEMEKGNKFIKLYAEVVEMIRPIVRHSGPWIVHARFKRALIDISSLSEFDEELFFKKLIQRSETLSAKATYEGYLQMILGVYNFRNSNPILQGSIKEE